MRPFLACLFMVACFLVEAQVVGTQFPELEAETLENKKVKLPVEANGKYTLIGMAYSRKSEDDMNTWFAPVFEKFIQESASTGIFITIDYDVNVFFIPMFTGVNAAASGTARKRAIKNIDPELVPHVLFYRGDLKPYKEALDFEKKDTAYFFVLDPEGKIVYATSGAYSEGKMDKVEEVIE